MNNEVLSPEAEIVWEALLQRHKNRLSVKSRSSAMPDPQDYYKNLYNKSFGDNLSSASAYMTVSGRRNNRSGCEDLAKEREIGSFRFDECKMYETAFDATCRDKFPQTQAAGTADHFSLIKQDAGQHDKRIRHFQEFGVCNESESRQDYYSKFSIPSECETLEDEHKYHLQSNDSGQPISNYRKLLETRSQRIGTQLDAEASCFTVHEEDSTIEKELTDRSLIELSHSQSLYSQSQHLPTSQEDHVQFRFPAQLDEDSPPLELSPDNYLQPVFKSYCMTSHVSKTENKAFSTSPFLTPLTRNKVFPNASATPTISVKENCQESSCHTLNSRMDLDRSTSEGGEFATGITNTKLVQSSNENFDKNMSSGIFEKSGMNISIVNDGGQTKSTNEINKNIRKWLLESSSCDADMCSDNQCTNENIPPNNSDRIGIDKEDVPVSTRNDESGSNIDTFLGDNDRSTILHVDMVNMPGKVHKNTPSDTVREVDRSFERSNTAILPSSPQIYDTETRTKDQYRTNYEPVSGKLTEGKKTHRFKNEAKVNRTNRLESTRFSEVNSNICKDLEGNVTSKNNSESRHENSLMSGFQKKFKKSAASSGHTDRHRNPLFDVFFRGNPATDISSPRTNSSTDGRSEKGDCKPVPRNNRLSDNVSKGIPGSTKLDSDGGKDILTGATPAKKMKQSRFSAPFKRNVTTTGDQIEKNSTTKSSRGLLENINTMSAAAREEVRTKLACVEEVALTLVYKNGDSQLREHKPTKKRKIDNSDHAVNGIAIAFADSCQRNGSADKSQSLRFLLFEANLKCDTSVWTRDALEELMESKSKKIIFGAQELFFFLLKHFKYKQSSVSSKWSALDPRIGAWLLDADIPPRNFTDLLSHFDDINQCEKDDPEEQVCCDISLLGPVMSRVYQRLKHQNLWKLYLNVETKLIPILAAMELRGIKINTQEMVTSCDWLKKKINKLEKEAHEIAGHSFIINSHPQLRQVLFEELKLDLKLPEKTKKVARTSVRNQKSTSEAVLTRFQSIHPLPALILEYRQLQKLKSTYVDGMMMFVKDDHLYTHWDHTAAATGRLTSTNPNIQAIPKQPVLLKGVSQNFVAGTEDKSVEICVRAPFVSEEGTTFLAADFQQIELRLLAHFSNDASLLRVFCDKNHNDIFVELASQWLDKSPSDISTSDREQTKRVVYSVMYGAGKERLAEYLKIGTDDAKAVINSFLVKFPSVNSFTKKCIEEARLQGYQVTLFKRRRRCPNITSPNQQLRAYAERQAVNFCIQGSAADLCKAAMIQIERTLSGRSDLRSRLIVQIHDELLLEVPDEHVDQVAELVQDVMESNTGLCGDMATLKVPLTISLSVGKSWSRLTKYNVTSTKP